MPLKRRRGFGGFNKRKGMMGNRHNPLNPRNRQREMQRRRDRERKRRERERRRREQQIRKRNEKKARQKQKTLNKHNKSSSNPLDKLQSNFENSSIGRVFQNNKTKSKKNNERKYVNNRPSAIHKRRKGQHLDDNHYKNKGKEIKEQVTKEVNRNPDMAHLSDSQKEIIIDSESRNRMKEYKHSVKSRGLKTNRQAFIDKKKADINKKIKDTPELHGLSKSEQKKFAEEELEKSVSNYDKQIGQRAVVTKEEQINSSMEQNEKRLKEREAYEKLEKLKHQESIPVSKKQNRKWKERGYNQETLKKEISAIKNKKGANRFIPKTSREKQIKELEARKNIEGKKQEISTLKMNRQKDRVLHKETLAELSSKRQKSVSQFKAVQSETNVPTNKKMRIEKDAVTAELNYRKQVYDSKRIQLEYKEKLKLAHSNRKISHLEAGKVEIENKRFISPNNRKMQLSKMNQTIARQNRKLKLNEYTHSVNTEAYGYKKTLLTSKLELKKSKLSFKQAEMAVKKKYKNEIKNATPAEKEVIKRKYESVLYDLNDKRKHELSEKRTEVKNARYNLEKMNKEYKDNRKKINLVGRKEEINAQLQNLEASYKELNRPRIFGQKRHDLLQQNVQQRKALQNELSNIDKQLENNKSTKVEQETRGMTAAEEKEVMDNYLHKNKKNNYNSAPTAEEKREQEIKNLEQEERKLKYEAEEIRNRNNDEVVQKAREEQLKQWDDKQRQNEEYRKQWEQHNQQAEELKEKYSEDSKEYIKAKNNLKMKSQLEHEKQSIMGKSEMTESDLQRLAEIESELSSVG